MPKSLAEHLAEVRRAIPTRERERGADEQATAPSQGPDLSKYRPLTPEEKAFLTYLLQHAQPDATAFLPQLEGMLAYPSCTCGCPSIDLAVAPGHAPILYPKKFVVDVLGGMEAFPIGAMLAQADGRLSYLEVYSLIGNEGPFGLPAVETLRSFETEQE